MPRPRNPPGDNHKERNWSCVLHNFDTTKYSKQDVVELLYNCWNPRQYVIAQENYNHQEGSHIHIYMTLKNQIYKFSILKEFERFMKPITTDDDKMLRRVDVKPSKSKELWHGCAYLMKDKNKLQKDKHYDSEPIIHLDSKNAQKVGVESTAEKSMQDKVDEWMKSWLDGTWWGFQENKNLQDNFRQGWCAAWQKKISG